MNDELNLEENNGRDIESRFRTDKTTTINEDPLTFTDLNTTINGNNNSTIYLSNNYKYNNASDGKFKNGIPISRNLTIYGNGVMHTTAHLQKTVHMVEQYILVMHTTAHSTKTLQIMVEQYIMVMHTTAHSTKILHL